LTSNTCNNESKQIEHSPTQNSPTPINMRDQTYETLKELDSIEGRG